jgi:hypothetical protein
MREISETEWAYKGMSIYAHKNKLVRKRDELNRELVRLLYTSRMTTDFFLLEGNRCGVAHRTC